ncbi:hypothetical protein [Pseudalkalibacillus caeni]|nr:hypothetical protein [Pseudalkalibacillus caeni]
MNKFNLVDELQQLVTKIETSDDTSQNMQFTVEKIKEILLKNSYEDKDII